MDIVNKGANLVKEFGPPGAAAALGVMGARMLGGQSWVQFVAGVGGAMAGLIVYHKVIK